MDIVIGKGVLRIIDGLARRTRPIPRGSSRSVANGPGAHEVIPATGTTAHDPIHPVEIVGIYQRAVRRMAGSILVGGILDFHRLFTVCDRVVGELRVRRHVNLECADVTVGDSVIRDVEAIGDIIRHPRRMVGEGVENSRPTGPAVDAIAIGYEIPRMARTVVDGGIIHQPGGVGRVAAPCGIRIVVPLNLAAVELPGPVGEYIRIRPRVVEWNLQHHR